MSRRVSFAALLVAAVFAIGACDAAGPTAEPASSAAGAISVTPTLLPEAAVAATIGPDGGVIEAADAARGLSYRLEVPAGAFFDDTEVSVTPIAEIGGFPFDGGLLGGVQLSPEGQQFIVPVILEIGLDANRRAALQTLIDDGQFVVGFAYEGSGDDLSVDLVEVADDLSTVRLTLFGFSGHGAGAGTPANLGGMGGNTNAQVALLAIQQILHPQSGPASLTDPAVRAQIADILRIWLAQIEAELIFVTPFPQLFQDVVNESLNWYFHARSLGFVSTMWAAPPDELYGAALTFKLALRQAFLDSLDSANTACKASGDITDMLRLLDIQFFSNFWGEVLPPLNAARAVFNPLTFCVSFTITAKDAPGTLEEGGSAPFSFTISTVPSVTTSDLEKLRVKGVFDGGGTTFSVSGSPVPVSGTPPAFRVDVMAIRAVEGNDHEGVMEIGVNMLGLPSNQVSDVIFFDITSPNTAGTFAGKVTVTMRGDSRNSAGVGDSMNATITFDLKVTFDRDANPTGTTGTVTAKFTAVEAGAGCKSIFTFTGSSKQPTVWSAADGIGGLTARVKGTLKEVIKCTGGYSGTNRDPLSFNVPDVIDWTPEFSPDGELVAIVWAGSKTTDADVGAGESRVKITVSGRLVRVP